MAYYEGTFSCGHDGCVNIIGSSKDRLWKKERAFSGLCSECYKKKLQEERDLENQKAAERSIEMELPNLTGSEKQVSWANTLRLNTINVYEEIQAEYESRVEKAKAYLEKKEKEGNPSRHTLDEIKLVVNNKSMEKIITSREELADAMDHMIETMTDAKFWIDNRWTEGLMGFFVEEYRKYKVQADVPDDVKEEIDMQKEQLTVVPDVEDRKSGVVELIYNEKNRVLSAKYIKNDEFIKIVKELDYRWSGTAWFKEMTEFTGTAADRAAELGNRLLLAGYTVQFPDEESKNAAISGKFILENDRWVKWNTTENRFAITWKLRNNTLYGAAKKLPGAQWKNGSMVVKAEFYKEVQDFAETMGFAISKKAQEEIEKYMEKENRFNLDQIESADHAGISDDERLAKSLKSGGTILSDLLDGE